MTSSAVRAPNSTRDNTSSPRTEVPNQCCQDGACCRMKSRPSALVWEKPATSVKRCNPCTERSRSAPGSLRSRFPCGLLADVVIRTSPSGR
ncbi:Uncharacterised protein [Mycobacteroides abscessus subsp. abscessus]|nr:Uncharacterised protein [Mycobacteroides abscessus subsp. abscessus]